MLYCSTSFLTQASWRFLIQLIEIKQANSQSFIISTIYRPPNSKTEDLLKIERLIQLSDNENKEVYILGDLNINLQFQFCQLLAN